MNKEYTNCKYAMTPSCPKRTHEFMLTALSGNKDNNITDDIIKNANSLCADCEEFTAKTQ